MNIDTDKQRELLDLVDFQKVNEKTLEECKNSEFIPPQCITEAALALCNKLRKELDDAKMQLKSHEIKSRPSRDFLSSYKYTSSRKFFIRKIMQNI
jgi:hypothetical protein